jgi:hypothetical protein
VTTFETEALQNEKLHFTVTLAGGEVLSFFSKEKYSDNIEYIDWFISNPDSAIKGLGEATLKMGFDNEQEANQPYYAVAKPQVKSFPMLIEKFGFVSFAGSTLDGEHKHHYARLRRFSTDKDYVTKKPENSELLSEAVFSNCQETKKIMSLIMEGKKIWAAKVECSVLGYNDDIKKTDPDGWILAEIEKQAGNNYVLTRFIPANNEKDNRTFYAVFEEEIKNENLESELWKAIGEHHSNIDQQELKKVANK